MAVSEPRRLALHAAARRALGEEEGDTLMALSPPANTDIATRQDVEHLSGLMRAQFAETKAEIAGIRAEITVLKDDMAGVKAGITEARAFTSVAVAELAARVERTANVTLRWTVGTMLAGNAAVIAIVGFLLR